MTARMPMSRRRMLRVMAAAGLWLGLTAHSPYRQWDVHRKTRLVVLVSAAEPPSVALGGMLASIYAKRLPESRAVMARARELYLVFRGMSGESLLDLDWIEFEGAGMMHAPVN